MSLVPIAEIGQVLDIRDIGLSQQNKRLDSEIAQDPHQLNDCVRLGQVNAGRTDLLPKEGHRIQPNDLHPIVDMQPHDPKELQQHLGITEIQIDLIVAEGTPDMASSIGRYDLAQQWMRARPDDLAQILFRRGLEEELIEWFVTLQVAIEPSSLAGHMVQHQIGHQLEVTRDTPNIGPVAQIGVYRPIVGYCETVVRRIGKEGQDMDRTDRVGQMSVQKVMQHIQRLVFSVLNGIAIGDDHRVLR